jgi:hypothetical protein
MPQWAHPLRDAAGSARRSGTQSDDAVMAQEDLWI